MKLRQLLKQLKESRYQPEVFKHHINDYIYSKHEKHDFVLSVSNLEPFSIIKMIEAYSRENSRVTVQDIIDDGAEVMFEFDNETYIIVGKENDQVKFRKIGSLEIIDPPFKMDDTVKRLF